MKNGEGELSRSSDGSCNATEMVHEDPKKTSSERERKKHLKLAANCVLFLFFRFGLYTAVFKEAKVVALGSSGSNRKRFR